MNSVPRETQLKNQFEDGGITHVLAACCTEPMIDTALQEYSQYEANKMGGMPAHVVVRRQVRYAIDYIVRTRSESNGYNPQQDNQIVLLEEAFQQL